jgi:hypothetical protein
MLQRRVIFILGMHRSGTSALARAVHLQGAVLPRTLMPAQADNPDGFWESFPIVQYNNSLLQDAGRSWDDPRPIDSSWWKQPGKRLQRVERAKQLLQSEFPDGDLIVLKDPRVSRLQPVWLDACSGADIAPSVFICCRNPLEVAASLEKRNGIDIQRAQLLWLGYMLEAERSTRGLPRAFIHFDSLLTDWREELSGAYSAIVLDSLEFTGKSAEATDTFLRPDKRHHYVSTGQLLQDERLTPLLKETWQAFQSRPSLPEETFDSLWHRLAVAWETMVPVGAVATAENWKGAELDASISIQQSNDDKPAKHQRNIILHYHFFKNAGTSLDEMLKANFGDQWITREFHGGHVAVQTAMADWIREQPHAVAFSSHTAQLPTPQIPGVKIFPVVFVRHPLDRIASVYAFERKQGGKGVGATLARNTTLAGYIEVRLLIDRQCRNFHCARLAQMYKGDSGNEAERALKAVTELPFVGLVEAYDESIRRMTEWLKPYFPQITPMFLTRNVSRDRTVPLVERLQAIRSEIGDVLYARLEQINAPDLAVYEAARSRYPNL